VTGVLLLLSLLYVGTKATSDFNCQDVCGIYSKKDKIGPKLHSDCKAFDKTCAGGGNVTEAAKKKKAAKRSGGSRVVGGVEAKSPTPWMVLLIFIESLCGGTLVNSWFIITAAHCPCKAEMCSRLMGEVAKEPVTISDPAKVKKDVMAFIGATETAIGKDQVPVMKWDSAEDLMNKKPKHLFYNVDKIIIHPDLGTDEKYATTPDFCLVKLAKQIPKWSDTVRPICLANPKKGASKPSCPDSSLDRQPTEEEKKKGLVPGGATKKMLGGCATVGGWGHRYDHEQQESEGSMCTTDTSPISLYKSRPCLTDWTIGDEEVYNCTNLDMKPEYLIKDCQLLNNELSFRMAIENKLKLPKEKQKYKGMDLDKLVSIRGVPVEVIIQKKDGKVKRNNHCSKLRLTDEEKKRGWCATHTNDDGLIKGWGVCREECSNPSLGYSYANMNLLTDEECKNLIRYRREEAAKDEEIEWTDPAFDSNRELCAGKKTKIVDTAVVFVRRKKKKKVMEEDKALATKAGLKQEVPEHFYKNRKKFASKMKGIPDDYAYNWFIGGVDTCQGDSGGPIWRNIKVGSNVRATQVGVVSRGQGCAIFNSPAIYTDLAKFYDWISTTVKKELAGKKACPAA